MAPWGYEFYLLVLIEQYYEHSKIKFVSPRGQIVSSTDIRLFLPPWVWRMISIKKGFVVFQGPYFFGFSLSPLINWTYNDYVDPSFLKNGHLVVQKILGPLKWNLEKTTGETIVFSSL